MGKAAVTPEQFISFGDLLKYLRRREELTQRELAIQVGYSDTQISRLEQNQRVPDEATLKALFVPALHLEREAEWAGRLLELARQERGSYVPESITTDETSLPPNNLPALLTTFIGREHERSEIEQLIAAHRLVTLTGAGGVGKTRLSLKVGGEILEKFPDGVWFVELAPLSDPDLLAQTVAAACGIATQSSTIQHVELLVNFFRGRATLLILDNCEHLLDACARLTDTLLKNCPRLTVLATSRQPLGILGEVLYRLPSLGFPAAEQTLEKFRDYESVRLFEERARLAQPDFSLTAENAPSVAQICSRLDGIPLAIELAAARVNIFSTAQIAERLVDCFDLLTGGSRTALPRQQTIRASIDWSWNLISEAERILLRRLTIFAGGCTLEAAEAVCSGGGIEPGQTPELMAQLVAKSLVITDRPRAEERRFHLHATISQYAFEKLAEAGEQMTLRGPADSAIDRGSGERGVLRDRHLSYCLDLARRAEPELHGPQQMTWFDRLTDERDNMRRALEHASRTDLEAGLVLSARLLGFWRYFDLREGLRWISEFVQNPQSKAFPDARARALLAQGSLLWNMQQFEAARTSAAECLEMARKNKDRLGEFDSLILMGSVTQFLEGMEQKTAFDRQALALARAMGDEWREGLILANLGWDQRDPQLGRRNWEEAIVHLRKVGDWRRLGETLGIMGFTVLSTGDLATAQKILDEAYEVNRKINFKEMEFILTGRGILALLHGDYAQARSYLQKTAAQHEEVGNQMGLLWARARLAWVDQRAGDVEEARARLLEVIDDFYANQNKSGLAFALDRMACLYVKEGESEVAASLIGWSDAARKEVGDPRPRIEQDELDEEIAGIKEKMGEAAFERAYQAGGEMTIEEAVREAKGSEL